MPTTQLPILALLALSTGCQPGALGPTDTADTADTADTGEVSPETPSNPDLPVANCTMSGVATNGSTLVDTFDENEDYTSQTYVSQTNPTWSWTTSATYEGGHQTSWTTDNEIDGVIDSHGVYTWDGDLLTSLSVDGDGDGSFDTVTVYAYDSEGNEVSATRDDGADGTIDADYVTTRDDDGEWTTKTEDDGRDGIVDVRWTHSVSTDADDVATDLETRDDADDGTLDDLQTWKFDGLGQTLYNADDADGSGFPDYANTYTWTDGHLYKISTDLNEEDGELEMHQETTRTWDAWGRTTRQDYDFGTSQVYAWEYTWTCEH